MAVAAGYAVLPVSASLLGITEELRSQLVGPTQKAAKQAGDAIRKSMTDGVDQASRNTEKAQWRVKKSTEELQNAESKLTEQKLKTEAANKAVESAARVRAEAESKGVAAVEKAEEALLKKRAAAEREARNLVKAEEGVEKALTESANAAKSLADRQEELDKATSEANESSKGFISSLQDMQGEMDETGSKAGGLGDKIMSGLGKVGTGALLGVGAKIGSTVVGAIGTAFDKGFGRLQSIEQAETMLGGLGHSAEGIAEIMDNAMDSVSGTAYGFGEAASMAATFAGAGIEQGEELTRILSLVGDSAAITGADFQEMGSIWTKMASSGRLSTDEMNQMMDRGLGLLPKLQEHYNVTADEARKMVSDGEVSFQDFADIMENMVGGSSQAMGDTFSGSAANMQAALGRLGAKFMDPIYQVAPSIFQAIGGSVDKLGEYLTPLIEDFSEKLTPIMEDFAERLGPWLEETIDRVAEGLKTTVGWIRDNEDWLKALAVAVGTAVGAWKLWTWGVKAHTAAVAIADKGWKAYIATTKIATFVTKLFNKATKANIFGAIIVGITAVVAGLTYFFTKTETGQKIWKKFTDFMKDAWESVSEKFGAVIDWISEKWTNFTGWLSDAWEGITSLFKGDFSGAMYDAFGISDDSPIIVGFFFLRDTVIQVGEIIGKIWDGIVTAGKIAFAIIGTVVLTPLILAWEALSAAWQWSYENVIRPVIDAFADAGLWLWEKVIDPVLTWIGDKWSALSDWMASVWESIRTVVFDAFTWYVDQVRANWDVVTGALGAAWAWVRDTFTGIWDTIRTAVFDAFNWYIDRVKANWGLVTGAMTAAWTWLKDMFTTVWDTIRTAVFDAWNNNVLGVRSTFETITSAISDKWGWLRDQLAAVWDWIRDNVFSKFSSTVDTVKSSFDTAVDAIGTAWSKLKALLAEPVNFIIREVYMGGVRKAWGAVADLVDLPNLPEIQEIGGFAEGTARVPGARTRHDNVHMVSTDGRFGLSLRGDEGVLVPEAVDSLGEDTINSLNHAGLHGGKRAADRVLQAMHLGGFARGGFIDLGGFNLGGVTNLAGTLSGIQRSHAQFVGRFFPNLFNLTSAGRNEPGSFHDFGSMAATDWQAKDGQYATQMPTPGSKALARAIFTNFPNSAELIHWPLDGWQNINDGAPHNYGAGTNAGHGNHVHWATRSPLQFDGDNIVLTDSGGGGVWESITSMAKRLWDGVIDKIPGFEGAGKAAALPGAFLKKAAGAAWDFIKSKADEMLSFFTGGSGGDAEQWRGLASQALKRMGYDDRYLDAMIQQIQIESNGDPSAVNNWDENAMRGTPSKGLLQVIDPTYRDVRRRYPDAFAGLPDDPTHPLTNLTAGVGAVTRDWGGPAGRWPTRDGYHNGGLAGWGQGLMEKTAIEPEMVLNPEMTQAFLRWMDTSPESAREMAREITTAFRGGDWGYGALEDTLGSPEVAQAIVQGAAALGEISREMGPEVAAAGRGYLETQASGLLDVVGLGGLVPMASGLADKYGPSVVSSAQSLMDGVSVTGGLTPGGVTVVIEAESDEDLVRVGQLKALSDRVQGLDIQVNQKRRPPAAAVTRGGAM